MGTHWHGFRSGSAGGDEGRAGGIGEVRFSPASLACTFLVSLLVFSHGQIRRRLPALRLRERPCLVLSLHTISISFRGWVAGTRYRAIGRLMVKCLLEGRRIGSRLAPSVFKFITGTDTTLRDLQVSEEDGDVLDVSPGFPRSRHRPCS